MRSSPVNNAHVKHNSLLIKGAASSGVQRAGSQQLGQTRGQGLKLVTIGRPAGHDTSRGGMINGGLKGAAQVAMEIVFS